MVESKRIVLRNYSLVVFFLFSLSATRDLRAETEQKADTLPEIDIYKESFYHKLGIYAYGITKFSKFELSEKKKEEKLDYSPNENFNLGLGFNYKWMGIGVAFNIGAVNSDENLKGKTKSVDLQVDLYAKKWIWSGNLQSYSGYYWSNPNELFENWSKEDSLIVRPDIETFSLGLGGVYAFNHKKYSLKAAFVNTEWQKKSAGSMLMGWYLSMYSMRADSTLVPFGLLSKYPVAADLTGIGGISLGSAFGYTYTLVIKKHFYANASLMIGLNLQGLNATDIEGNSIGSGSGFATNAHFRFATGVNKEKVYYGLSVNTDRFLLRNSNKTDLSYTFGKVRIFYGRRFNINKR